MVYECAICNESLESAPPTYDGPCPKSDQNEAATATPEIVVTPCGHIFHNDCLVTWFQGKHDLTCPACRRSCQNGKIQHVFPTVAENGGNISRTLTNEDTGSLDGLSWKETKEIHETLIKDYAELQDKYWNAVQSSDIKEAQVESYAEANKKLEEEIQKLKESNDTLTKNEKNSGDGNTISADTPKPEESQPKIVEFTDFPIYSQHLPAAGEVNRERNALTANLGEDTSANSQPCSEVADSIFKAIFDRISLRQPRDSSSDQNKSVEGEEVKRKLSEESLAQNNDQKDSKKGCSDQVEVDQVLDNVSDFARLDGFEYDDCADF